MAGWDPGTASADVPGKGWREQNKLPQIFNVMCCGGRVESKGMKVKKTTTGFIF